MKPFHASAPTRRIQPQPELPPYLLLYQVTAAGRIYHVAGKGFVATLAEEATPHPIPPSPDALEIDVPENPTANFQAVAPLFVTAAEGDRLSLAWGNRTLHSSRGRIHAQAGGEVWESLQHHRYSGQPFGPALRLRRPDQSEVPAFFNIEVHPNGVVRPADFPASERWDQDPRSIRSNLVWHGFTECGPQLWQAPLPDARGWIALTTGSGSVVESLAIHLDGQPEVRISPIDPDLHANLLDRLPAWIAAASAHPPLPTAYFDTVFEIHPQDRCADFWVITAHDPNSRKTDPATNHAADLLLQEEILRLGLAPFRVIGWSPDESSHSEAGWGLACDESTALRLGKAFAQRAIYHFRDERIDLLDCLTGQKHPLAPGIDRFRDPARLLHFTLFLGTEPGHTAIPEPLLGEIHRITGRHFPGYTVQSAEGCFEGRREPTLLVHLASRRPQAVLALAHELRAALSQKGIGISHRGIYQRVREGSDDAFLLRAFGLTG